MQSFKLLWEIPDDATPGLYQYRAEFDDWDIDALPTVRHFEVG